MGSRRRDPEAAWFEVVVGNLGTVYRGHSPRKAANAYDKYVKMSENNYGRVGGESVVMLKDGEPCREHAGIQEA